MGASLTMLLKEESLTIKLLTTIPTILKVLTTVFHVFTNVLFLLFCLVLQVFTIVFTLFCKCLQCFTSDYNCFSTILQVFTTVFSLFCIVFQVFTTVTSILKAIKNATGKSVTFSYKYQLDTLCICIKKRP